ncbi:MAG: tol-pal system protein YbgF [Thiobacillus sp.]
MLACAVLAPVHSARAQTVDLGRQVQALQQLAYTLEARVGRLENVIQQNQRLLGLLQEVESLKAEVARLRGQAEVQTYQMDTLGKRQNDLYVDLDQRITDIAKAASAAPAVVVKAAPPAPQPSSAPTFVPDPPARAAETQPQPGEPVTPVAPPVAATPTAPAVLVTPQLDPLVESRTYETAFNQFREANYAGAIAGFKGFLKAYPDSALAPNAQYWVGYSYYALKDYKSALAHQQKLVAAYPGSAKVPDSLFNIASNQMALDNFAGARKTLEELVAKYPGTNAATLANRRLAALK